MQRFLGRTFLAIIAIIFLLCFTASLTFSSTPKRRHFVSITVSPSSTTLNLGGTKRFSATVSGTNNTSVTWSTSGGIITSSGSYTAPNTAGTYTVKATSAADTTKSASAIVTVTSQSNLSVSITPASVSTTPGSSLSFAATVSNASNTAVTWSVSSGALSVSGNTASYIAPSTSGTYIVKATSVADTTKSASATVVVTANVTVSVNPTSSSLQTGGTQQFASTVTGCTNTAVTWAASGGTVSSAGLYTAPSTAGTYSVTATSVTDPTKFANATVTVATPVSVAVSVNPSSSSVQTSGTQQFSATVTGTTNTGVTWVASGGAVSSSGLYTAPATAGTYAVTATSVADTSKSASATVTVTAPTPVSVSVTPTSASLAPSGTASFTATVSNSSNTAVTWTASGGTISGTGNTITYTAPAGTGSYILTATSVADTSKSATASITDANNPTPTFEGFGANATGGSTVVHVTNTNASGTGSLASALSGSGRHVVFDVGGTISLGSSSLLVPANTFIDGFSAPSAITITGSNDCLHVWNSNIIIQGIRVRNCGGDDIQIAGSSGAIANIVVDHVETEAGGDGNIDVTMSAHDVTVSWSIMANNSASGLQLVKYNSYHVSLHHNIYYNSFGNSRVPWCEGGNDYPQSGSAVDLGVICDMRYNIMSKWLIGTLFESDGRTLTYGNVVSNFYDGQDSSHARNNIAICPGGGKGSAYVAGNVSILNPAGTPYCNYSTAASVTTTNSPSNHGEYTVPGISGPTTTDAQGRVDEWTSVLNQAGVVTHFADDATASGIRAGITLPTTNATSLSWNK